MRQCCACSISTPAPLRGEGIAPRALTAFLGWAAAHIGLRRAHLACHIDNVASRRVAEKCGFTLAGREGEEYQFWRDVAAWCRGSRRPPGCRPEPPAPRWRGCPVARLPPR